MAPNTWTDDNIGGVVPGVREISFKFFGLSLVAVLVMVGAVVTTWSKVGSAACACC